MKPKVSAIVSAYFAEQYLDGRLLNLMEQSPQPEIIVICRKNSPEFDIASKHDFVVVPTTHIPTIYAAWNMALHFATGEYITNANSDDRLYPGALSYLASLLDNHPDVAVVYGDSDIVSEIDGDPIGRYEWIGGSHEQLLKRCFVGPMPMWRASLHPTYGVFDEDMRASGDYEFWLRVTSHGEKLLHSTRVLGAYLKHGDSAEQRQPVRSAWETARARSRYPALHTYPDEGEQL